MYIGFKIKNCNLISNYNKIIYFNSFNNLIIILFYYKIQLKVEYSIIEKFNNKNINYFFE